MFAQYQFETLEHKFTAPRTYQSTELFLIEHVGFDAVHVC